ncbi:MAG: hypothetical protein KF819_24785 [Labilithrix sp.]|nr:hypothetical protein [Labilithrix sp.]
MSFSLRAPLVPLLLLVAACAGGAQPEDATAEQAASSRSAGRAAEKIRDGLPRGLAMQIAHGEIHAAFVARAGADDHVVYIHRPIAGGVPFAIEEVASASALEGTGLAVDAEGEPHVAFFERGKIMLARRVAGSWQSELVDADAGASLLNPGPRVAVGSDGVEHVVYAAFALTPDGQSRGCVKYAARAGAGFAPEIVDPGEVYDPGWRVETTGGAALVLDDANVPHVCYAQSRSLPPVSSAADLKYARRGATGWTRELVEKGGRSGGSCSIALAASGAPSISHLDWGSYDLRFAVRGASGWSASVVDADGAVGRFSSLAFDASGAARVAYVDETSGMLKLASASGASWAIEDVLAARAFSGGDMVSALDGDGAEHFLLTRINAAGGGELVYVR